MGFVDAVKSGFTGYVDFRGRSSRSEYWWFLLFYIIVIIALSILDISGAGVLVAVGYLAFLLPTIAVQVRRLHDIDRSGWWILITFVPIVGAIVLLVWYCTKGSNGSNRFGQDPLGSNESSSG